MRKKKRLSGNKEEQQKEDDESSGFETTKDDYRAAKFKLLRNFSVPRNANPLSSSFELQVYPSPAGMG